METLFFCLMLGTSLWMAFDASQIGYDKRDVRGIAGMGPFGWFFAGLLIWIVAFPLYIASRGKLKEAAEQKLRRRGDSSLDLLSGAEFSSANGDSSNSGVVAGSTGSEPSLESAGARIGRGVVNTLYVLGAAVVVLSGYLAVAGAVRESGPAAMESKSLSPSAAQAGQNRPVQDNGSMADELELLEHRWGEDSFGFRALVGTVRNNTSSDLRLVTIEFALFDGGGAQIGTVMDNTGYLGPGATWRFAATVLEDSAKDAKIVSLYGFY